MKIKSIIAFLLALCCMIPLAACSTDGNSGDTINNKGQSNNTEVPTDEVKVKVLKAGRSLCTIIRTTDATVVIDTSDVEHAADLTEFLAEKGVTHVDAVILTNYSKKCIGGMPDLLSAGVTVGNVYGPTYVKESDTNTLFENALNSHDLTTTKIGEETTITYGDLKLTLYPALKDYSTADDENDDGNSMAVGVSFGDTAMLFTSRVAGERVSELTTQLGSKTFDLIAVPNFGIYDANLPGLLSAVKAKLAVVVASNTNPPENATMTALTDAGIKAIDTLVTRDGSIEITSDGKGVSMKQ